MRKGIIKALVLLAVFCTTVIITERVTYKKNIDLTAAMEEATLPVVYLQQDDKQINRLFGYTEKMDGTAVRDTITPLGEERVLPVKIKTYQKEIKSVTIQVRSLDMKRLIQEETSENFPQENGEINISFQIQNLLESGIEYMLVITLETEGDPVYFYTRLISGEGYNVKESLDFVMNFHNQIFDKENAGGLATYLEPNKEGDNTTLQKVTIHSSLKQVTWGDMAIQQVEAPIPSVKEISSSYNTIVLNYVASSTEEEGITNYYNIEEYYRVRYANKRMYLLNYERTMNQMFDGENLELDEQHMMLGIRNGDVEYRQNENGTILAFVQEGELWSYNGDSNRLSRVFSYQGAEGVQERENNQQHQIKIIRIDESGSMYFVVYGYMNRGNHEGRTGISVYHYDSVGNSIEEQLFIPSNQSNEMLNAGWGKIFYVSSQNIFYVLAEDVMYRIDLNTRDTEPMITGLQPGSFAVSEDGRFVAWGEGENIYQMKELHIMDLADESTRNVKAEGEELVYPIGFVESDFVYGTARTEDIITDGAGNTHFAMYRILIVNETSKPVKEYRRDGYYISNAYVENQTIFLEREVKEGTGYVGAEPDKIKNQQIEASPRITVETVTSEQKQQQVQFSLTEKMTDSAESPQIVTPKELVVEEDRTVVVEKEGGQMMYHVYSAGKVILSTHSVAKAVRCADENMGVVIGDKQGYIWRRGRKRVQAAVGEAPMDLNGVSENSIARCLTYMLRTEGLSLDVDGLLSQGKTPKQILSMAMDEWTVVDLTGCSVAEILYYVNQKTPILAIVNGEALLVVGYDEHNTILYDPQTNNTRKMGLQDSDAAFAGSGNVFLGYIKP